MNRCSFVLSRRVFRATITNAYRRMSMFSAPPKSSPSVSSAVSSLSNSLVRARVETVVKSAEDKRSYRALELNNGMRVLIVSDPTTDKAAAAINVAAGHLMDPRALPGLAHFCEHMLFLGTEKYPVENAYNKFLQAHGGMSNAYTASDHTNYHFEVSPEHLDGALDRFAQFFLCPLFTESATDREVKAVDSENSNNLQNDGWRLVQLERSLSDPNHDYSKFGTGNKTTLMEEPKTKGVDTRTALLEFHNKHYSSNTMALCILGRESLDELENQLIVPLFDGVENKNNTIMEWKEHPYSNEQLGFAVKAAPVKDIRGLHVSFPIPDLHPQYHSQPGHYIGHLLGHEGPGSLLSELKRKGWVNTLSAGPRHGAKGFAFFSVDVDLTEEGLKHVDEIVLLIFEGIGAIKREGIKEWIHKECEQLNAINFRFKDKEKPLGYVRGVSSRMFDYPLNEALIGPYIMDEYKPELIENVLDRLVPSNMNTLLLAKEFEGIEGNLKEKWYGTEYSMEKFGKDFVKSCENALKRPSDSLKMPEPNEFIPTKFELLQPETKCDAPRSKCNHTLPTVVRDDRFSRVWYKQDDEYNMPKSCIFMHLSNPVVFSDPLHTNLTAMYVTCLQDALTEYTYNAGLAGLGYGIENGRYGIVMKISGYNEKQRLFAKRLVEKMAEFVPDPERFASLKELYVRSLRNFEQEQPYSHAIYHTSLLLSEKYWAKEELLAATGDLTVERLKEFVNEFMKSIHIEALVHGNTSKEEAISVVDGVLETLRSRGQLRPLVPSQLTRDRELEIPKGQSFAFESENQTHANSAVEMVLQTGVQEIRENVRLELVAQILSEPAFDTLRTKESLGYIIFTSPRRSNGTQSLRFIVQGEKDPKFAEERIEAFLAHMRTEIESMPESEFETHKTALAANRMERPKRLSGLAIRYWSEISCQQYHFDRAPCEVEDLHKITKAEILDYFDRVILPEGGDRRKLAVRVTSSQLGSKRDTEGQGDAKDTAHLINNVTWFKQGRALYPLPPPYINIGPPGGSEVKSML